MESARRRVVITGMGAVSPLGLCVEDLFRGAVEGRSGAGPITRFDASTYPVRFACEVRHFDLLHFLPGAGEFLNYGLNTQFAAAAGAEALAESGLSLLEGAEPTRFGLYLGTGEGEQDFERMIGVVGRSFRPERNGLDHRVLAHEVYTSLDRANEYEKELHTTPARLAEYFGLEGPNWNCLTACAAGTQAIGEATDVIRAGEADLMFSGGTHSMVHPFGVTGFSRLTALSTRNDDPLHASRPFDLKRDGFVLGEGAGIVILEELEHARRRGASILAEVTGYGSTADAYRVTDSCPDGRMAGLCMRQALADAGLAPEDIGYINAHGTSTQLNDRVETVAIKQVFGETAYRVPISSSKSMVGHTIAAAGGIELVLCVLAIQRGVLPPTINYEIPDPECDLDYIPNQAREARIEHALSNSFGFGGQNVSLIVSRFRG